MSRVSAHRSTRDFPPGSSVPPIPPPATSGFLEAPPRPRPSKRLILCEDGTWQTSDGNVAQGGTAPPSNVVRLARAIKPMSRDGIPQVVNYHVGVGASGSVVDKVYGGISGEGVFSIFFFVTSIYSFLLKKRPYRLLLID